jgi:hypothetical protein
MTLRALTTAARAKQAHDWDMAAMIASAWVKVDFGSNPFRERVYTAGSFDVAALHRMHKRLKRESQS